MNNAAMLGNRIKEARKARGISRAELARRVGMPYSTLAEIENGRQQTSNALLPLAGELGVSPEWLRTGKGPMRGPAPVAPSQSTRLNPAIMSEAFQLLRNSLAMQGYAYDVAENPELLCMTYEYLSEAEEVTPSNLVDFGKRLAEARTKGESRGKRGEISGPNRSGVRGTPA